jgi:hypothetical protein
MPLVLSCIGVETNRMVKVPGTENDLGRWLGVAEIIGHATCSYVLKREWLSGLAHCL